MVIFKFDVTFYNQYTEETETIRKEYFNCSWHTALDSVTQFVKDEVERRHEETGTYEWSLDTIKEFLA